jgi:hypothetical protein
MLRPEQFTDLDGLVARLGKRGVKLSRSSVARAALAAGLLEVARAYGVTIIRSAAP